MEEKETMKMGNCLIKYESHSGEGGISAELEINGKGLDIIVGLRCIINDFCRKNNIPISVFLGMIEHIPVKGISIDVGAIEAMEGLGHE